MFFEQSAVLIPPRVLRALLLFRYEPGDSTTPKEENPINRGHRFDKVPQECLAWEEWDWEEEWEWEWEREW